MMNGWNRSQRTSGASAKRRYKSGHRVQFEGMYTDGWGGALLLLEGDVFPAHPHMGDTCWTYAGPLVMRQCQPGSLQRNGHWTATGEGGFTK